MILEPAVKKWNRYADICARSADLDARDSDGNWYESYIVGSREQTVQIHYIGWPNTWDDWIERDSARLQPLRSYTKLDGTSIGPDGMEPAPGSGAAPPPFSPAANRPAPPSEDEKPSPPLKMETAALSSSTAEMVTAEPAVPPAPAFSDTHPAWSTSPPAGNVKEMEASLSTEQDTVEQPLPQSDSVLKAPPRPAWTTSPTVAQAAVDDSSPAQVANSEGMAARRRQLAMLTPTVSEMFAAREEVAPSPGPSRVKTTSSLVTTVQPAIAEPTAKEDDTETVESFLGRHRLAVRGYPQKLREHGFDDVSTLRCATADDLKEAGLLTGHARKLLGALQAPAPPAAPSQHQHQQPPPSPQEHAAATSEPIELQQPSQQFAGECLGKSGCPCADCAAFADASLPPTAPRTAWDEDHDDGDDDIGTSQAMEVLEAVSHAATTSTASADHEPQMSPAALIDAIANLSRSPPPAAIEAIMAATAPDWTEHAAEAVELFPCDGCGRKFNEKAIAKHVNICKKVRLSLFILVCQAVLCVGGRGCAVRYSVAMCAVPAIRCSSPNVKHSRRRTCALRRSPWPTAPKSPNLG
jgi:hypothetical protein